jgi:teichuronic acid biosynthesis glycosyltransferase TuaH
VTAGDPYIVWFANKLWEDHGTHQRLAREMERHARILWIDVPVSPVTLARRRFGTPRRCWPTLSVLSDRVTRLTPTAPPGLTRMGVRATTAPLMRAQVRWALRRTGIEPCAVVCLYLEDLLGQWGKGVVTALHGTDDFVAGAELMGLSASRLRAQEKKAVGRADVVAAVSPALAQRWSALRGGEVTVIPNGCTPVLASPQAVPPAARRLPRPVVGLAGRLNARIDMDLVEAIVEAGFSLLVVGPHDSRWEPGRFAALTARPNVHYVGRVKEDEVPAYIAATDVGITPYLDSPFNRASFPLKTLDYVSAGRPAVSTSLPAARWLLDDLAHSDQAASGDRILALADDADGFVRAVRRMVGDPQRPLQPGGSWAAMGAEPADAALCRAFAGRHSWSRRADTLASLIGLAN